MGRRWRTHLGEEPCCPGGASSKHHHTRESLPHNWLECLADTDSGLLTLELDFILNHERLALVVDLFGEFGRDGMVSSCVLDNQALITLHTLEDMRLLDSPFSNICPFLILVGALGVLLGVRWFPSRLPVVCKLLNEVGLDFSWLAKHVSISIDRKRGGTVGVAQGTYCESWELWSFGHRGCDG